MLIGHQPHHGEKLCLTGGFVPLRLSPGELFTLLFGLLPSRGKRGLRVRSSPLLSFLFLSHGLGGLSQVLAGRRSRGSRGIHRWVRSGSLRDSRLHESAIPASRGGRLRHAGGVAPPRTPRQYLPNGYLAGGYSPAGSRRHHTPLRALAGRGGERLGRGGWGPVRCAPPDGSPPLPGPVISPRGPGGGADWRIPLRTGPALDRQRVLAGSGTRHRRGGAARGFILGAPVSTRTSLAHIAVPRGKQLQGRLG